MPKILGIDLGTTNSAMAIVEGGEPRILENEEGARTTPSMVAISKAGDRLVGLLSKRQAVTNPENTIFSVKRLIGRKFSDAEVQKDKALMPYAIRESANGGVEVKMNEKWYRPEEISAMILQKLKKDAEAKTGEKISEAVITVPAYFDDSQRAATKAAGEISGFNVRRILPEPTAAALAYGFNKKKDEQIVVYDFGGGTFDISVLEVSHDTVEVRAISGDTHLGGDDFDQRLISYLVRDFVERSIALTREAVTLPSPKGAGFKIEDIDEVILVGGQTRMPLIQEEVKKLFGKEPNKSINPDEVVAIGAAVQAGILQGDVKDVLLLDVTPLSLGLETLGGVMTKIVEKNTTVPYSRSQTFSTASDNQTSVDIHVLQGEREMAGDNKTLGTFILDGIPPAPRGMPQIEVTFDIDANGILSVKAKDKASGKEQSIRIEASTGLHKDEIERMKKDAEMHATEDKAKREMIEEKNKADALIYSAEKAIREAGEKLSPEIKKEIEGKSEELKKVKDSGAAAAEVRAKADELSRTISKIGEAMYRQTPPGQGQSQNSSDATSPHEKGKDAEYDEVKDDESGKK